MFVVLFQFFIATLELFLHSFEVGHKVCTFCGVVFVLLISVGIFIYLRYKVDENELLKKMEAYYEKNKNNPAKRTNFMANLEAMQKELERRNEELKKNNK